MVIYTGAIGTILRATIVERDSDDVQQAQDISLASTKDFYLESPTGVLKGPLATSFTNDGSDGKIEYATQAGDIDEAGRWHIIAKLVIGAWQDFSTRGHFKVNEAPA